MTCVTQEQQMVVQDSDALENPVLSFTGVFWVVLQNSVVELAPVPNRGIGWMAIGTTFVVGGQGTEVGTGIGKMAVGSTFIVGPIGIGDAEIGISFKLG